MGTAIKYTGRGAVLGDNPKYRKMLNNPIYTK
jgi:hypothetical protein